MKKLFRHSCLGFLAILLFGLVAILSVLAVVFQQSQAVTSNAVATVTAHLTPSRQLQVPTLLPPTFTSGGESVTIQIDPITPTQGNGSGAIEMPVSTSTTPITVTSPSPMTELPGAVNTEIPRYSGTSSYPMTVTAEVMLGLTHVANYEAGVGATRTAIAAESVSIFATLTAAAPTPTGRVP